MVGWLLARAGGDRRGGGSRSSPPDHPDHGVLPGKRIAAQYFALNVLPGVAAKAALIATEDRSAIDVPIAAFAS